MTANGKVSFWDDENVPQFDYEDGCTALRLDQKLWNCTLELIFLNLNMQILGLCSTLLKASDLGQAVRKQPLGVRVTGQRREDGRGEDC